MRPSWEQGSWLDAPIIVSSNEIKDVLNERAALAFAQRTGQRVHWYECIDTIDGGIITDDESEHLHCLHTGETHHHLGRIPLVVGMPVMITHNFDVEGGIVNGCMGTLVSVRYTLDQKNRRHAVSCVVHTPSTSAERLPHLQEYQSIVMADTVDINIQHPFRKGSLRFKQTQLPIVPGFAMTAHKSQGMTLDCAIIDLEGCAGTESPYMMLSRVKTLEGVIVLRPFSYKRITCRQSEDVRREFKRLDILNLLTIIHYCEGGECLQAERELLALTGNTQAHMLTVSMDALSACVLCADNASSVLDNIEREVTNTCAPMVTAMSDTRPIRIQKRPLKRRASREAHGDGGRHVGRMRTSTEMSK